MVVQIPQHAHCQICGKATQEGVRICGPTCQGEHDALQKKRRHLMLLVYAMMAVFVGSMLLSYFRLL